MDVFAALADPGRRRILRHLASGPARVVDLAAEHAISRPAVSKHLRLLSEAGLVDAETRGRERHYRLEPPALRPVVELVAGLTADTGAGPRLAEGQLDALDLEVRRTVRDRGAGTPAPERSSQRAPGGTDRQPPTPPDRQDAG
jgi:DNA-binding transcriptional ArsR family regulator